MLTITRRLASDPVQETTSLEQRITRFLNDAFGGVDGPFGDGAAAAAWVPAVDVFEDADAIRIVAEVPGVSPDAVKISHENNVLTIQGTKPQTTEKGSERRYHYERAYGAFARSFTLPATVDPSAIKATYEHGVLTVTLPKVEQARPRQIQVQVAAK
jgi:HSP20 family protein